MAKYNVGGLNPFNRAKDIHEGVMKALPDDEISWNHVGKFQESIKIRYGIHITGNGINYKIPEHRAGMQLDGAGNLILENINFTVDSLAHAIRIVNWTGTVTLKKCNINYKKRVRAEKTYSLFTVDGYNDKLKIEIEDCYIDGINIAGGVINVKNSTLKGGYKKGNISADDMFVENTELANIYSLTNSTKFNNINILGDSEIEIDKEGLIKNLTIGKEDVKTNVIFSKNVALIGVKIIPNVTTVAFKDGTVSLKNVEIPDIPVSATNSAIKLYDGVVDNGIWSTKNTQISNQSKDSHESSGATNAESTDTKQAKVTKSAKEQINEMIGLDNVKKVLDNYIAMSRVSKAREEQGLGAGDYSLHLIMGGNPGTGKTTVARIFAQALFEEGILPTNNVVVTSRADLVADVVGGTAPKTRKVIEKAIGGVLFIDEAYELRQSGEKDFANEAVSELIAQMENHRKDLVVIMAGYTAEMKDFMDNGNPGLASRFNNWIDFPDYTFKELWAILKLSLTKQFIADQATIDAAQYKLFKFFNEKLVNGNGRFVRNFMQEISFAQSLRLSQEGKDLTKENLKQLTKEDVENGFEKMYKELQSRQ